MKFLNFFYFCGSFLPPWIRIRIRIPNPDGSIDLIESGSNPDPGSEKLPETGVVLMRGNRKAKSGDYLQASMRVAPRLARSNAVSKPSPTFAPVMIITCNLKKVRLS
jgi:hypothetical protein